MKITIIGPSSSGKSTLSRKISSHFNIPRLEIDRLWFGHGGHHLLQQSDATDEQKAEVRRRVADDVKEFLSSNKDWVIDGTYSKIQPLIADQAESVVYIKRPLHRRVLSHIKRVLQNDNRHPETTRFEDLKFTKTIIKRWSKAENEKINKLCDQYKEKLVILKSFKQIDDYFNELTHEDTP